MRPEQEHVAEHAPWTRYFVTWVALMALTFLTFGLSYAHTGAWELPIAILIAVAKSTLVLLFFMHLIEQRFINAFSIIGALSLLVMLVALVGVDVDTRHTYPVAPLPEVTPPATKLAPPAAGGVPSLTVPDPGR
jgi:cytochrome c oxidase subunit 4